MTDDARFLLERRTLLAGALAGAASAGVARADPAPSQELRLGGAQTQGFPAVASVASPLTTGYVYRTLSHHDFQPQTSEGTKFTDSFGAYSNTVLYATMDLPADALCRDVEFYAANSSGAQMFFNVALWSSGSGIGETLGIFTTASVDPATMVAERRTLTSEIWGPYPRDTRLLLIAFSDNPQRRINGVRVGFSGGGATAGLKPDPITVYDSAATGGKFAAGEVRIVPLNASAVPPGSVAATLRIETRAAAGAGTVKVYSANRASSDVAAMYFPPTVKGVGEATVTFPVARKIKVEVSHAVHVKLSVVATFG